MTTKKNLTKRTIEAIKDPDAGRDTYQDAADRYLHLVVAPSARTWRYIRKVNGQVIFITLGRYPDMTPDQARQTSRKTSADIANGKDPRELRRQARKVTTWYDLFKWYVEFHAKPHKKSWKNDERQEARYCSSWRTRRWESITPEVVTRWHKSIGADHGKIGADRALAMVKCVFNKALAENIITGRNPATTTRMYHPTAATYGRSRFLQADELARLFAALDGYHDQNMSDFFKLCIFTGARRGNVQGMRWKDFDGAGHVWEIPGLVSKNGEPMRIPLLPPAVDILSRRWDNRRSDEWVFPSRRRHPKTPYMAEPKFAWAAICKAADLKGVRMHDLRRTLGSWMAMGGTSLAIIGRSLGHKDQKTTEVYARLNMDPVRAAMGGAVEQMMLAANGTSEKTEAVK